MKGCGLKQREPQPRPARLPLSEARADWQAESEPKGPSLPLLPMPIFAQPEQVQSKEYVTAARVPAGRSKAKARTIARLTTSLEYVLDFADYVSSPDKSPRSAVSAVFPGGSQSV